MRSLLPDTVQLVETTGELCEPALFPQEEALVSRAVQKRRQEFSTGRRCAHRALSLLDQPAAPLLQGSRGEPAWPDGVVGAITHCEGYRAAAVALSSQVASIGIDAEPSGPLPPGVLDAVSRPEERRALALAAPSGIPWDRLLFSAKESVYKAWYPLAQRFLDFDEASVHFEAPSAASTSGTFRARLLPSLPPELVDVLEGRDEVLGRWAVRHGLAFTAVVLTAPADRRVWTAAPARHDPVR